MSSYFITAIGTDIGKTFTTCALVHARPEFMAYKPVVTGFSGEDTDTHRLIGAMGKGTVDEVSPWRYGAPLAPDMAAAREGKKLPFNELLAWSRGKEDAFIESIGGVMVPLTANETTRDWMELLGLPTILVAGTYLGSLSHTLTALAALREASIRVRAVVLSESAEPAATLEETHAALARQTETLIVAQPRVSTYREAHAIHALAKEL